MSDENAVTTSAAALASSASGTTTLAAADVTQTSISIPVEQHEAAKAVHEGLMARIMIGTRDEIEAAVKKLAELLHL